MKTPLKYIDIHCHPNLAQFDEDRHEVIQHMADEGVAGIVIGMNIETSTLAVELAEQYDHLWAIIGLHPAYTDELDWEDEPFRKLIQHPKVVGVGECGFDYFRIEKNQKHLEKQERIFRSQIELALEFDKPLMLHIRPSKGTFDAYDDAVSVLQEYNEKVGEVLRGDCHFYAGQEEHIKKFVDMGFYISYTGVITFANEYHDLIRVTPRDRILAETDSPYVAPVPFRGSRCEPTMVKKVYEDIAVAYNEDEETIRKEILENVTNLFKIKI